MQVVRKKPKDNYIRYIDGEVSYNGYLKADAADLRAKATRRDRIGKGLGAAAAVVGLATSIYSLSKDSPPNPVISVTREAPQADGSYIETKVQEVRPDANDDGNGLPLHPIETAGIIGMLTLGTAAGIALEEGHTAKREAHRLDQKANSQPDHTYKGN